MHRVAAVLKKVYSIKLWRNPDGTYGADVEFTSSTEVVVYEDMTLEWLFDTIYKDLTGRTTCLTTKEN